MKPFYAERQQKSNIQENSQSENYEFDLNEETNTETPEIRDETNSENTETLDSCSRSVSIQPCSPDMTADSTPPTSRAAKKQSQQSSMVQVLAKYFDEKQASRANKKVDHLQKYFEAIQETVRTFTPQLQIEIKSKISQLVSEYELKNLMTTQSYPPFLPYTTDSQVSHSNIASDIDDITYEQL